MNWSKQEELKYKTRKGIHVLFISILLLAIMIILGLAVRVIMFPANIASKGIDTANKVVGKTMDANNAIHNYEWFKQQEAHIRQCLKNEEIAKEEWESFIKTLPDDREKWKREDKEEEGSLRNSYYALQKLTNKAIEDYNARSSMANRNIFKDNLPSNITRAWYAGMKLIK